MLTEWLCKAVSYHDIVNVAGNPSSAAKKIQLLKIFYLMIVDKGTRTNNLTVLA